MATASAPALMEPTSFGANKLSYEIFSILESKFLFGYDDPKLFLTPGSSPATQAKGTPCRQASGGLGAGRVRILSIDGSGRASDGLLAAVSLARLESSLRRSSGDPSATIVDFFDVAAGSGAGGVLAAMLFTCGPDGRPLFSAEEALRFFVENCRDGAFAVSKKKGLFRGLFRQRSGGVFRRVFGNATLRDTMKPVLIPCYDLATGAPVLFSRADAVETDGYDFKLSDVCAATCADASLGTAAVEQVEMRSVDGQNRIVAVGGGVAMGNPTAAAITHVLNNKLEFPFTGGVEDLIVVSLGTGGVNGEDAAFGRSPSAQELVRIAGESAADMVDQAVAMAFGPNKSTNYLRIQGNVLRFGISTAKPKTKNAKRMTEEVEEILSQRTVESLLFRGKKISEQTNGEKLERFSGELIKEQERRKKSPLPTVILKQMTTPRTSSATTSTIITATATPARSSTSPAH